MPLRYTVPAEIHLAIAKVKTKHYAFAYTVEQDGTKISKFHDPLWVVYGWAQGEKAFIDASGEQDRSFLEGINICQDMNTGAFAYEVKQDADGVWVMMTKEE